MVTKENLVSCFLPVYNASAYLPKWWQRNGPELSSVDAQLVVVDNGSTDGTVGLIRSFDYARLEIIEHGSNRGLEESFKSAKAVIFSKYRMFLPADDWLAPGYLSDALEIFQSDPDVGVVYGRSYTVDLESGATNERFRPHRPAGPRFESPFSTILFNNFIPDISLYRSCHLDCNPTSWEWFLPGWQSAVLRRSKSFYTNRDQCFSGKSGEQISKEWGRSGRYYSELGRARAGARNICCDNQAAEVMWYLIEANFHTGKSFLELLQMCIEGGHPYVQSAIKNSRDELIALIASSLADELIVDADSKTARRTGRYGSIKDLTFLLKSISGDARKSLALELVGKGMGGVLG